MALSGSALREQGESPWLVVGDLTSLKNDGVRQWKGWHPIYEMENNPVMFQTTNQMVLTRCLYLFTTFYNYKQKSYRNHNELFLLLPPKTSFQVQQILGILQIGEPKKWVCLKMGYTPNEIAIKSRDNDQQNHWVVNGYTIFRQTQMNRSTKIIIQQQPVTASRRLSGGQRAAKRLKRLRLRGRRKTWCIKLEELVQFVKGGLLSYIGLYMFLLVYIWIW